MVVNRPDNNGSLSGLPPISPTRTPAQSGESAAQQMSPITASPQDVYQSSGIVNKVASVVGTVGTYVAGVFRQYVLEPLSENAQYLFSQVIPLEIKQLAQKWKAGTLTESERAKLNTYLDMNKVKNRYEFLNRIVNGDLSTAGDGIRQKKYQLNVSRAEVSPNGRITQNGQEIDPKFAVVAGSQALVTRDGRNQMITVSNLLLFRQFAKDKVEAFTVSYIEQTKTENMLKSLPPLPAAAVSGK